MEQLLQLDKELFLFLNGLGTTTFDGFWMFITGKWNSMPLYALLLFLLYKKMGLRYTGLIVVVVILMIAGTDQLSNLFKKVLFLRPRPCHEASIAEIMRLVKSYCGGSYGYFSAHAASSMALAVFLGKLLQPYYKYAAVLLLVWALFVGYSRIYIGVHYPGDVIAGAFLGALIGWLVLWFYRLAEKKWLKKYE